jgi:hypothetical protein
MQLVRRGARYRSTAQLRHCDGDGIGDLAGIVAHLGHLNDGTARRRPVASPIYPRPADVGYGVADYVTSVIGSLGSSPSQTEIGAGSPWSRLS